MTQDQPSTTDRILDAAEELYAEQGFAETSMRQLTQRAEVNLAAVNYHFGSKEGLFHALIRRRLDPINLERLSQLDALEAKGEVQLEEVLHALLDPILNLRFEEPAAARLTTQIIGGLTGNGKTQIEELGETFRRTSQRFVPAIARTLPPADPLAVRRRMNCLIGVMIASMLDPHGFLENPLGENDAAYRQLVADEIVSFLAGGLRAASAHKA